MSARATLAFAAAAATLLGPAAARAEGDLQLWLEAGVAKKLDKRFAVGFEQHLRFDQDVSRLQAVMPEVSASYRAADPLRFAIAYRLLYERDGDGALVVRHRGHVEARVRHDVGPVELTYRLRFQEEIRPGDDPRHTLRNRLSIQLEETKPWLPTIAAETFHRLGDEEAIELRKLRLTAAVVRTFGDHEAQLFYQVEILQADPLDPVPHILGAGYHYDL
jgi:hypothetical protein